MAINNLTIDTPFPFTSTGTRNEKPVPAAPTKNADQKSNGNYNWDQLEHALLIYEPSIVYQNKKPKLKNLPACGASH
ncbi:hypothetical protein Cflav_PD4166 [Pedosphaera parvula Ellin514]|uniref:Uncharacterized protein n=1 Tax=Pedosphaera parvula (strain Ellin514) TaxID=320771 RepID=B9XEZ0_PEDPL|nr:hypothetical protein Cflav_PD4166 [Pedosphaera parvula Ellin514]